MLQNLARPFDAVVQSSVNAAVGALLHYFKAATAVLTVCWSRIITWTTLAVTVMGQGLSRLGPGVLPTASKAVGHLQVGIELQCDGCGDDLLNFGC